MQPTSFQKLATICAILEIQQRDDETLRGRVTRIKEECFALLRVSPKGVQEILNRLVRLLKNTPITDSQDVLDFFSSLQNDGAAREAFYADLISMEDYGLDGSESEETLKEMRVDAFKEAINSARSAMQDELRLGSQASITKTLKLQAGHMVEEMKQTQIAIVIPMSKGELGSTKEVADMNLMHEEYEKNRNIYIAMCVDHQRPDNLTMENLYSALMQSIALEMLSFNNDSIDLQVQRKSDYLDQAILDLLSRKLVTQDEADRLKEIFDNHHTIHEAPSMKNSRR